MSIKLYRDAAPTEMEQKEISDFAATLKKSFCIRHMVNRGYGVGGHSVDGTDLLACVTTFREAFQQARAGKLEQ